MVAVPKTYIFLKALFGNKGWELLLTFSVSLANSLKYVNFAKSDRCLIKGKNGINSGSFLHFVPSFLEAKANSYTNDKLV